ncbi:MAG: amidohydrolase family protein [Acidimicrobiia bacterium]|nr:amidohydrolase family protein [Acidimicrobiia bacterium]
MNDARRAAPTAEIITAARVVTPGGVRERCAVSVRDGAIATVSALADDVEPEHDLLAPGFVDLQVNGHDDIDVATMTEAQWSPMRHILAEQGVTTWFPTLVTSARDHYAERLDHLAGFAEDSETVGAPTVGGVHLEGPYLGERHGAHSDVPDGPIDLDWLTALPTIVRIMTLGPERSNAVEATRLLVERGIVVALGHTAATYEQVTACVDAGATLFTHCFNATAPLHHRTPGAVGAALSDDRLAISLIVDNVHVHPAVVRLAARCKPVDKTVLITDAAGWRSGRLGTERIEVRDGAPRLADGTLAGINLTMDVAVRHVAADPALGLEVAMRAATANPAALVGLTDRGALTAGMRADLVAFSDAGAVAGTWVAGHRAH